MWQIARIGNAYRVSLNGVVLRKGFASYEAALAYTLEDEDSIEVASRAILSEA